MTRTYNRSRAKVDADGDMPRKKVLKSDRPMAPLEELAAAAAATEDGSKRRRDEEGHAARKSPASGVVVAQPDIGSNLDPDEAPGFSRHQTPGIPLHPDGDDEGKSPPRVVLPKSGSSNVTTAACNKADMTVDDSRDKEGIPAGREGPSELPCSTPIVQEEDAVQQAGTLANPQVKDFMAGISDPGVLQSRLSKVTSLLVEATSIATILHDKIPLHKSAKSAALSTRVSELEQQVQELTNKLSSTEEELEAARATLRGTQAAMLEVKSDRVTAIAAMNSLAMRTGASFARLGTVLDPLPSVAVSLEETVKQMTALVSLIGSVSHSHATSLARSRLTFGVADLLCRGS